MWYPKAAHAHEEIIKKSRFISALLPFNSKEEAAVALQNLHREHPSARHIAFAWRIMAPNGLASRFHDAGEPAGTAGKPILHQLEGNNVINAVLAVIRYFGGVKLGAGGLARAYGNCAKQVLEKAELIPYVEYVPYQCQLNYRQTQEFEYLLKKLGGEIIDQQFEEKVRLLVKLPKHNLSILTRALPRL